MFADVPEPAGATKLFAWDAETEFRLFTGSSRVVEKHADVTVYIDGTQFSDGHAERNVTVHQLDADDPLTVEQARRLAQALIDAADEAEEMNGYDQIVVSENR